MENEKKKAFLCSYLTARNDVVRLEQQLSELQLQKIPLHNIISGASGSKQSKSGSDYMVKIEELEQEIIAARYRRICVFQAVRNCVEQMEEEREKTLLTYRYLQGIKWEEIAVRMAFSLQHVHRIHAKAIAMLPVVEADM